MNLNYIDIHSHLNLSPLVENKESILEKMKQGGIGTITVGTGLETSREALKIAEENENCWATVGIHPCDIPTPTLPEGEGEAPGYLTGSGLKIKELMMKALEMRENPTPAESVLWDLLKKDKSGFHFRRQHIIDHFIVDFVCLKKRLILEIDGDIHDFQRERDSERDQRLETLGFEMVRYSNNQVLQNIDLVINDIKKHIEARCSNPLPFGEGWGGDEYWHELEQLAQHPKTVAIGETGLDYFRDQSEETKQKQVELFKKHIELANKVGKPLMLHVRASKGTDDAYYDALEILSLQPPFRRKGGAPSPSGRAGVGIVKANFHFFSGSQKCMEDIVAAGFTISVDGPITFSKDYDDMIKAVPLDKIMVETDAPFAAPAPYRGKTCEPWMVIEVAKKIAELKGLDLGVVRTQVLTNTVKFFGLDL